MPSIDSSRPSARIFAGALVLAAGLQIAESLVPRIPVFPWLRLGLSWAILLPFLLSFGVRPTLSLFLARNVLSLTFGGQPPSTFLVSSLSGVLAIALCGPVVAWTSRRGWIGWIGASVALSATFNALQLLVVTVVLVGHAGNLFQLGPILAWSVASGTAVAWIARRISRPGLWTRLEEAIDSSIHGTFRETPTRPVPLAVWSGLLVLPFAVPGTAWQLGLAGSIAIVVAAKGGVGNWLVVWRSWPYFAFLAWLHLLETPGHFLSGTPVTMEGLRSFALHGARLCSFLLVSQELSRLVPWTRIAPTSLWARGIGLALPLLPGLFPAATRAAKRWWRDRRNPDRPGLAESILSEIVAGAAPGQVRDPRVRAGAGPGSAP